VLYALLKITQSEKDGYRQKLKEAERSLQQLRLEYFIMEEREQIYKRESSFMETTKSMLHSEIQNSHSLLFRMENHINMLNTLLLPHDFVKVLVEPTGIQIQKFSSPEKNISDSDSSSDDMLGDYGAISVPKASNIESKYGIKGTKSMHIDHIDFMNCQKLINEAKRDSLIYKNQNELLTKENDINNVLLKQL